MKLFGPFLVGTCHWLAPIRNWLSFPASVSCAKSIIYLLEGVSPSFHYCTQGNEDEWNFHMENVIRLSHAIHNYDKEILWAVKISWNQISYWHCLSLSPLWMMAWICQKLWSCANTKMCLFLNEWSLPSYSLESHPDEIGCSHHVVMATILLQVSRICQQWGR